MEKVKTIGIKDIGYNGEPIREKYCSDIAKEIDEITFEFLNKNGYTIEKPYTLEKAIKIKEQLDRDGKYLDWETTFEELKYEDEHDLFCMIKQTKIPVLRNKK